MKAAVFYGSEKGLRIEAVPLPKITPDQILVKVAACGVCHTELDEIEGRIRSRLQDEGFVNHLMITAPDYRRPTMEPPQTWRFAEKDARELANTAWWEQFNDPALN